MNTILVASLLYYYTRNEQLFMYLETAAEVTAIHGKFKYVHYEEARLWCKVLGSHMPRNMDELNMFNKSLKQGEIWIDAGSLDNTANDYDRDKLRESYLWKGSEKLVSPWTDETEPDCREKCCAVSYLTNKFQDDPCESKKELFCISDTYFTMSLYHWIDSRMRTIIEENKVKYEIVEAREKLKLHDREYSRLQSNILSNRAMGMSVVAILIFLTIFIILEIILRRYFDYSIYERVKRLFGCGSAKGTHNATPFPLYPRQSSPLPSSPPPSLPVPSSPVPSSPVPPSTVSVTSVVKQTTTPK